MNICDFPEEILTQIFQLIECDDASYRYTRLVNIYYKFATQICIISNLIMTCKKFSFLRRMKYLVHYYEDFNDNNIYYVTDYLGYYGCGPSYTISKLGDYNGYNSKYTGHINEHLIINNMVYDCHDLNNINRIQFFNELYNNITDTELLSFLKDNMKSRKMLISHKFPTINIKYKQFQNLINKHKIFKVFQNIL